MRAERPGLSSKDWIVESAINTKGRPPARSVAPPETNSRNNGINKIAPDQTALSTVRKPKSDLRRRSG